MARVFPTVVAFVFVLSQATLSNAYRTCYDCARIPHPRDCDHVIKCADDSVRYLNQLLPNFNQQNCYVEEVITDSGMALFNLGCRSKKKCQHIVKRLLSPSTDENARAYDVINDDNGDLIICEQCCEGDHCNSQGCNSEPLPPLGSRGPVCYNCHQQVLEDSCDQLKMCDATERCFMSIAFTPTEPTHMFTSGCRPNYFCGNILNVVVGRRDIPNCTGCCTGDYCNRNCSAITPHITTPSSSMYSSSTAASVSTDRSNILSITPTTTTSTPPTKPPMTLSTTSTTTASSTPTTAASTTDTTTLSTTVAAVTDHVITTRPLCLHYREDKPGADCKLLEMTLNICSDPRSAYEYCSTTCKLC